MNFEACIKNHDTILMEGALGERLKREYGLAFDDHVAMAGLIYQEKGAQALSCLWKQYMQIAQRYRLPFLATTPTRRANRQRVELSGFLDSILADNVAFLRGIQKESGIEMYVGGLMGCKGDAYTGAGALREEEALAFHQWQAQQFARAEADFLYAGIMPALPEAAGMARAMEATGLPYIISFTIEANGCLIDGTPIAEAIAYIDEVTRKNPVCYMTNCVHPSIVCRALLRPVNRSHRVRKRFLGIQANTSPLSYAELDGSADLKCSEPEEFAEEMLKLRRIHPIKIWGGCCGTDNRHMECLAKELDRNTLQKG